MAEARVSQDEFLCPVCLDLLKDPVAIPCGHNYCKSCIPDCWDQEDQKRVYSCPQCRQTFSPRPALARNTMLAEVVEKLKKTKLPDDCYAGAEYEMICQKHEKLLEVFCRTDQKCICVLCTKDEHKNHDTVSTAAQRTEKQAIKLILTVKEAEQVERLETGVEVMLVDMDKSSAEKSEDDALSHVSDMSNLSPMGCEQFYSLEEIDGFLDETFGKSFITDDVNDDLHRYLLILNTYLRLSERNRVITFTDTDQPYPDHPDRFDEYFQVLCRESACGRCYWELQWSGDYVYISVSYKSISRKGEGDECVFGCNDQSWSLFCSYSSYSFIHNNIQTALPVESISRRIGVFVDHSAGTLSFYSVSDTMSLIHTVQTTFTQPLYPGFYVYNESSCPCTLCYVFFQSQVRIFCF
uniref:Tripartite motif-containing protein 16-like n=1 Tax=Sinocyclocheilus rhinocerous TaxID=307959 RepID=A0A673KX56_9TELE